MLAGAGVRGLSTQPRADGTYTFTGVAPGTYTIKAIVGGGGAGAAPNTPTQWAAAEVNVSGQDLDIPLTLQPGVAINGRVVFEGSRPTAAELQTLSFALMPPGSGGQGSVRRRRPRGCGGTLHVRRRHARHVSVHDDVERARRARQMDDQVVHRERPRGLRGAAAREPERNARVDGHVHGQADEPDRRPAGSAAAARRPTTTFSSSHPTASTGRPARAASA